MKRILAIIFLLIIILLLIIGVDFWRVESVDRELPGTNEQYYKIVSLDIPSSLSFAGEEVPLDIFYVKEI